MKLAHNDRSCSKSSLPHVTEPGTVEDIQTGLRQSSPTFPNPGLNEKRTRMITGHFVRSFYIKILYAFYQNLMVSIHTQ